MPSPDRHEGIVNTPDTHPNKFSDRNRRFPTARERGSIAGPPHFGLQPEKQRHPRPPPPPPPPPPGTPPPENMPQNNKRRGTDLDGLVHPARRMRARYDDGSDEEQKSTHAGSGGITETPKYKATDANLIPLGTRRKRTECNTNPAMATRDPTSAAITKASAHAEEELPIKQSPVAVTTMQENRKPEPTAASGPTTLTPPRSTNNIVHSDTDKADRTFSKVTGESHRADAPSRYGATSPNAVGVKTCDASESGAAYSREQTHQMPLRTDDPINGRNQKREAEDRHRKHGSLHAEKIHQTGKERSARYNRDRSRSPHAHHEESDSQPTGRRRRAPSPWPRRDYRKDPHARDDLDGSSGFRHYEYNSGRPIMKDDNSSIGHKSNGRRRDHSYHEGRDEREYDRMDDRRPDEHYCAGVRRNEDWFHGDNQGQRGSYRKASSHESPGYPYEYEDEVRRYDSREEPPSYRYERGNRDASHHHCEDPGFRQYERNGHARREPYRSYDGFERTAGQDLLEEEEIGQYEIRNRHRYAYDGPRGHGDHRDTPHSHVEELRFDKGFKIKGRHQEITEHIRRRSKPDKQHIDPKDEVRGHYDERTKHRLEKGPEEEYEEYKHHHHQLYKQPSHQKDPRLSPYEFTEKRRHYADEEDYYPIRRREESVTNRRKPIGSYDEDRLPAGAPYDYVKDWTVSQARTNPGATVHEGHLDRNGERKRNRNARGDELHEDSRRKRKAAEYTRREENPRRSGSKKRKTDANKVKGSLESRITRDPQTAAESRKNQGEEDRPRSAMESRKSRNRSHKRARRETRGE